MRVEDREEIEAAGIGVRHCLVALYRESAYRRTAIVDGEVAACWGDQAPLLSLEGQMWLFTAPPVERLPLSYYREARREIAGRLRLRSVVRADVAAGYTRSLRFFEMLGFEVLPVGSDGSAARREIRIAREG